MFLSAGRIRRSPSPSVPRRFSGFIKPWSLQVSPLLSSTPHPKTPGPKGRVLHHRGHRRTQIAILGSAVPDCAHLAQTFGIDIDKNVVYACWRTHRPVPCGTDPRGLGSSATPIASERGPLSMRVDRARVTGCLWSWTSSRVALSASARIAALSQRRRLPFNAAIHRQGAPRHLSTDHDPLFQAHRWTANLRILEIDEIKTPRTCRCHTLRGRLIGTMRREFSTRCCSGTPGISNGSLPSSGVFHNAARCHASLRATHR